MNLETTYLGLALKNPLVPSASPLSKNLDSARELEDAGASALVMYSLFEEEIEADEEKIHNLWHHQEIGYGEADSYLPVHYDYETALEAYIKQLSALKTHLDIPIIASLNGTSEGGWIRHAKDLETAGADALELNIWFLPEIDQRSEHVESRYIDILKAVKGQVNLPISVKLSSQFTSPANMARQLDESGADGIVLFNRFYQPNLDLESLEITPKLNLSSPYEALLRMQWIGRLYKRTHLSLAATGGIHSAQEVIRLLLAGADITQLCATLLKNGTGYLATILTELEEWLEENEYKSVEQLKGSVSYLHAIDPMAYERLNYLEMLKKAQFHSST